jgi:hypothetical protein
MQLHHSPIRRSFSRFLSTSAILEVPGTKSLPRFTLKKLSSTPALSYYYDIGSDQHGNKRLGKMSHTHTWKKDHGKKLKRKQYGKIRDRWRSLVVK